MSSAFWRLCLIAVCGGLLPAMGASPASAHSSFLESTPQPGERLATPPSRIVMVYTEPLNARLTSVRLRDVGSDEVVPATVRIAQERRLVLVPRERLAQGAYQLEWRSVSTIDAHIREGSVGFGVGTAALGASVAVGGTPLDGAGPARVAVRWAFYAALFFFAGGVLNGLVRTRRGSAGSWLTPVDPTSHGIAPAVAVTAAAAAWRRTTIAAWIAFAAATAMVALETADATGGIHPRAWADFLTTGAAGVARVGLVAALFAGALLTSRWPRAGAAAAAAAFVALSLGGHASGADPRWLAIVTNLVHLVAAAVWAGGIAQLAWAWLPALRRGGRQLRRAVVKGVLPRFGQVALPAFLLVAATGSVNALLQLGHVSQLWSSAYGRVLALKILLVVAIACISYVHAFRVRPRVLVGESDAGGPAPAERTHRRLLASEALVTVIVLVASAALVAFPVPPREVLEAEASLGTVQACDPCPFAAPEPDELAVGAPLGPLTAGAWLRREGGELVGTLRVIDGRRKPAAVPTTFAQARTTESCGRGCWRFRLPGSVETVDISAEINERRVNAKLPAQWERSRTQTARRLLAESQAAMRRLRTYKMEEVVSSAQGTGAAARGLYEFQAPNRMRFTGASNEMVNIGKRGWIRLDAFPVWDEVTPADAPFRVRDGFRWTVFASTAQLIRLTPRTAELALFDYGYPVWYRLKIDRDSGLVREEALVSPENRIRHRFSGFNTPIEIAAPDGD